MIQVLRYVLLAVALSSAVFHDIRRCKIPNSTTLSAAIGGIILSAFEGWDALMGSLVGFAAALAVGILLWLAGAFRAGDAKLYAALGAVMGWRGVLTCFLWSMLAAGAAGLIFLLRRRQLLARLKRIGRHLKGLAMTGKFTPYQAQPGSERELPLAPFIAVGAALAVVFPLF